MTHWIVAQIVLIPNETLIITVILQNWLDEHKCMQVSKATLGMLANELNLSELPSWVHSRCSVSTDGWLDRWSFQLAFHPRERDALMR